MADIGLLLFHYNNSVNKGNMLRRAFTPVLVISMGVQSLPLGSLMYVVDNAAEGVGKQ